MTTPATTHLEDTALDAAGLVLDAQCSSTDGRLPAIRAALVASIHLLCAGKPVMCEGVLVTVAAR